MTWESTFPPIRQDQPVSTSHVTHTYHHADRAPIYRMRIAHSHTLKDGWRCSETTVEVTWDGKFSEVEALQLMLRHAHEVGEEEARLRNAADVADRGQEE